MTYYTHLDKTTGVAVALEEELPQDHSLAWTERKMLKKQAEIIAEMNRTARKYHEALRYKQGHDMYMLLQNAALENETIMSLFQEMMAWVKMVTPDDVPGLTSTLQKDIIL